MRYDNSLSTNEFIAILESNLEKLKKISKDFNSIPAIQENSSIRVSLNRTFIDEKIKFNTTYARENFDQLEALHKDLSNCFNQYVIDYFGQIESAYKAPSFVEYILTPSPTDSAAK